MTEIFVFGSNREGRHGKGAAKHALTHHGAKYGQAKGLQGTSYAIVTKELRKNHSPVSLYEIEGQVKWFLKLAEDHPEMQFMVTEIGCGLAGFKHEQIAPLFGPIEDLPENVVLPMKFIDILTKNNGGD